MSAIATQLGYIQKQITDYETQYGREAGSVTLLGASKGQSLANIREAYAAGQTAFGENYLQEALEKIESCKNDAIEWHFIGPIQSNKTRKIAEHFAWVHSVSDHNIARRLNEQRPEQLPPLNICIEVNISHESTKSGIHIEEVSALAAYCLTLSRLRLRGLMTIPALETDFSRQRQAFHQLYSVWQALRQQGMPLDTLSMGMSQDFEAAIAEGATMVRIGTAIFGKRT